MMMVNDIDCSNKEELILCLQYSEGDMNIYEVFVRLCNVCIGRGYHSIKDRLLLLKLKMDNCTWATL